MTAFLFHPEYRSYYFGPEHPFSPVRQEMLLDLRKQQFGLRLQHANGTLTARHQIRQVRRNIAQVKTVLNQLQGQTA